MSPRQGRGTVVAAHDTLKQPDTGGLQEGRTMVATESNSKQVSEVATAASDWFAEESAGRASRIRPVYK